MKFIDLVNITVVAGNGGNGRVSFLRGKNIFFKRTNGSNGGDGGSIFLLADKNINTLNYFCLNRVFRAGHGQDGKKNGCTGKKGKDLFIKVPCGIEVHNKQTHEFLGSLYDHKEYLMVARGGNCGVGNANFKSIKNRKVSFFYRTNGSLGESHEIQLELMLIADIGIYGLPNSGKSCFVRSVSRAKPKVANYPFTTLSPCLGVVSVDKKRRFIIADIPGIVQGASTGLGLGLRFLKHLEHCKILLHFVDLCPLDNSNPIDNIRIIENELKNYGKKLSLKSNWLIFNKIDLLGIYESKKKVYHIIQSLQWKGNYFLISALNKINVKLLCNSLIKSLYKLKYLNNFNEKLDT